MTFKVSIVNNVAIPNILQLTSTTSVTPSTTYISTQISDLTETTVKHSNTMSSIITYESTTSR